MRYIQTWQMAQAPETTIWHANSFAQVGKVRIPCGDLPLVRCSRGMLQPPGRCRPPTSTVDHATRVGGHCFGVRIRGGRERGIFGKVAAGVLVRMSAAGGSLHKRRDHRSWAARFAWARPCVEQRRGGLALGLRLKR